MAKFIILRSPSQLDDREALTDLFNELEIGVEEFDEVADGTADPDAVPEETAECEPEENTDHEGGFVVVVLNPACAEDEALQDAVQEGMRRGCKIVGIWSPGQPPESIPKIIEDFGSSVVAWDLEQIRRVLIGGEDLWQIPSGEPRLAPYMKRNKC